jgi:hypothetical protein
VGLAPFSIQIIWIHANGSGACSALLRNTQSGDSAIVGGMGRIEVVACDPDVQISSDKRGGRAGV